ncbi:MAG: bifunctional (p)ppGpp synthetase/guanosine-3',5'-bis(diphosphate) 3'-pyrophosphohydrolase, partial [Gammaproteobacteria bacterium]|nr:bifunctional (p)ppGpp synthetase/guanosine-3',5'-bis(diphosphate) 3'-pyrophosphohydrolase [Gammaproteobacteria bacterium]
YPRLDGLLSAIGRGEVSSAQIAGAVREQLLPRDVSVPEMVKPPVRETGNRGGDVTIEGVGNLMTHTGGCCKPAPPDPIVGYITRGHGITIHRQDCSNVLQMGEEDRPRLLEVSWSMGVNSIFPVDVYIQAYNRQGMLRDVTTLLASEKVNLLGINTHSDKEEYIAHIDLTVGVPDVRTLSRLLGLLSQLPNVLEVRRKGSRQIRRMR